METIRRLKHEALGAATHRGHKMSQFKTLRRMSGGEPMSARSICHVCEMDVIVNTHPEPNGADICGEAVALPCGVDWSSRDQYQAEREGWIIAQTSGSMIGDRVEIQKLDDADVFDSDKDAVFHVLDLAVREHSLLHIKALKYLIQEAEKKL